jgi:hypothetical protein
MGLLIALLVTAPAAAQLEDFEFFIELNDTDGDVGVQMFLDGEGYDILTLSDPRGRRILTIRAAGNIGQQGLTELFFESAEPSFEEQSLEEFLELFPEGRYRVAVRSTEGGWSRRNDRFTHILPDAPIILSPADGAEDLDPDDVVIEWMTVDDPPGSAIVSYEVIVGELRALLEPDATSFIVPPDVLEPGETYQFEILAKEESGNQTISSGEFSTAEEE